MTTSQTPRERMVGVAAESLQIYDWGWSNDLIEDITETVISALADAGLVGKEQFAVRGKGMGTAWFISDERAEPVKRMTGDDVLVRRIQTDWEEVE